MNPPHRSPQHRPPQITPPNDDGLRINVSNATGNDAKPIGQTVKKRSYSSTQLLQQPKTNAPNAPKQQTIHAPSKRQPKPATYYSPDENNATRLAYYEAPRISVTRLIEPFAEP